MFRAESQLVTGAILDQSASSTRQTLFIRRPRTPPLRMVHSGTPKAQFV